MTRAIVFAIVEGQTENAVLSRLLGAHLGAIGIDLHCPIVKLGNGRGGVKWLKCEELCDQIQRHLKDRRQPYVSTFFDYYGLPRGQKAGWAFVDTAKAEVAIRGLTTTVESIENELHRLVVTDMDLPNLHTRFIPYIQLHELEALFFAEPEKMSKVFDSTPAIKFAKAVVDCGGCEAINDSPQTAPSKRIQQAFPGYIKGRSDFAHGPRLADKLDLRVVRAACPRFSHLVSRLEALAPVKGTQNPQAPTQIPPT
jgi:hypothetical protein